MKGKGNDGKGNNPLRDEWKTSNKIFNPLFEQYGFTLDCCANENNKKCIFFSDDFLNADISKKHIGWMNPPFSKAYIMFEHFFKVLKKGVAIYRCDNMETKVWQEIILYKADWIFIPNGRIAYIGFEVGEMRKGKGTRFPSALIGVGVEIPKNLKGRVLLTKKGSENYIKVVYENGR